MNPILSMLTARDYARLIRRQKRAINALKRDISILEDRPMTDRQMAYWFLAIIIVHLAIVAAALLLQ